MNRAADIAGGGASDVVCECRITTADVLELAGIQDVRVGSEAAAMLAAVLAARHVIEDAMCDAGFEALATVLRGVDELTATDGAPAHSTQPG